MQHLPFSPACERNQDPILSVLKPLLINSCHLLEIGSGTGQHAVYFAKNLPHVTWHTSDLSENHIAINSWLNAKKLPNTRAPFELNVQKEQWPEQKFDVIYSANTLHIMSWKAVEQFFAQLDQHITSKGLLIIYGPFNYQGKFTSDSNQQFEQWLKSEDPQRGIRDFEAVNDLAEHAGLSLINDNEMPANNRLIVWQKNH